MSRYGPHRPADHLGKTVMIITGGRRAKAPIEYRDVPLPAVLIRQREAMNRRAYES